VSPSALPSVTLPLANASATALAFFVFFGTGDAGAFDDRSGAAFAGDLVPRSRRRTRLTEAPRTESEM